MEFTINGFVGSQENAQAASPSPEATPEAAVPRKSIVQVLFPGWEKTLAYYNDLISKLVCDCFCSYPCKHEFAAMLHLRETLDFVQKQYAKEYAQTGCFTAICKETLFAFAVDGKQCGSFTL